MLKEDKFVLEMRMKEEPERTEEDLINVLRKNGYFVVAEIDVRNIIMKNFGKDLDFLKILEVCKPKAALDLFSITREIGLFLPCKILISKERDETLIRLLVVNDIIPERLTYVNDTLEIYLKEIVQLLKEWYSTISGGVGNE